MVFTVCAPWWSRITGLWKLPDGRDWLRGKLGLVLMDGAMLSKSLIQFSVDGWSCVPSLLFTRVCLQCGRPGFDTWVRKILWRKKWQPTPVPLPRKIPWTGEPSRLQSMGPQRVRHDWATSQAMVAEKAMAPHSRILTWKLPWMEELGRPQSVGSLRIRHDRATSLSLFTFMHWRWKWQPTPVFLPGEFQGRRSLVACHLWGRTESDTTKAT